MANFQPNTLSLEDVAEFDDLFINEFIKSNNITPSDVFSNRAMASILLGNAGYLLKLDEDYIRDPNFTTVYKLSDQELKNRLSNYNLEQIVPVTRIDKIRAILDAMNSRAQKGKFVVRTETINLPIGSYPSPSSTSLSLTPSMVTDSSIGSPFGPASPTSPGTVILTEIPPVQAPITSLRPLVGQTPGLTGGPEIVSTIPKKNKGGLGYYLFNNQLYLCGGKTKKYKKLIGTVSGGQLIGNCWIFPRSSQSEVTRVFNTIQRTENPRLAAGVPPRLATPPSVMSGVIPSVVSSYRPVPTPSYQPPPPVTLPSQPVTLPSPIQPVTLPSQPVTLPSPIRPVILPSQPVTLPSPIRPVILPSQPVTLPSPIRPVVVPQIRPEVLREINDLDRKLASFTPAEQQKFINQVNFIANSPRSVTSVTQAFASVQPPPPKTVNIDLPIYPGMAKPTQDIIPILTGTLPQAGTIKLGYYRWGNNVYLCGKRTYVHRGILKKIGGEWDKSKGCWKFPLSAANQVGMVYKQILDAPASKAKAKTKAGTVPLPPGIPKSIRGGVGVYKSADNTKIYLCGNEVMKGNKKLAQTVSGAQLTNPPRCYAYPIEKQSEVIDLRTTILNKVANKKRDQQMSILAAELAKPETEDTDPNLTPAYLRSKWNGKISISPNTLSSSGSQKFAQMTYSGDVKPPNQALVLALDNWWPSNRGGSVQRTGYKKYNVTVFKN